MSGKVWEEFETKRAAAEVSMGMTVRALGVVVFMDDFEIQNSRVKSDTGVYLMLGNEPAQNQCTTESIELLAVVPKGYPLFECLDTALVEPMQELEQGLSFNWPPTNTEEMFIGMFPDLFSSVFLILFFFNNTGSLLCCLGDHVGQCKAQGFGGPAALAASRFSLVPTCLFQGLYSVL